MAAEKSNDSPTARTLWIGAHGFYEAARLLKKQSEEKDFPWPAFFVNVSFAFELSLKAWLRHHGADEQELKKFRLRHNLGALMALASERGYMIPSHRLCEVIDLLYPMHRDHELRYLIPKMYELPDYDTTFEVLSEHMGALAEQLPLDEL